MPVVFEWWLGTKHRWKFVNVDMHVEFKYIIVSHFYISLQVQIVLMFERWGIDVPEYKKDNTNRYNAIIYITCNHPLLMLELQMYIIHPTALEFIHTCTTYIICTICFCSSYIGVLVTEGEQSVKAGLWTIDGCEDEKQDSL